MCPGAEAEKHPRPSRRCKCGKPIEGTYTTLCEDCWAEGQAAGSGRGALVDWVNAYIKRGRAPHKGKCLTPLPPASPPC